MTSLPQPGDIYASAFVAEVNECWRMVHDYEGKAHFAEVTTFTGRWYSPRNDGTYWRVWSYSDHLEGLTGVREFRPAKGAGAIRGHALARWLVTSNSACEIEMNTSQRHLKS
jgi:hypothetical protein